MLIDLALIAIDPPVERLFERDLAAQRRGLKDCEGAGQVAQPFFAARLGFGTARDRLEPVELLDGVGVRRPCGKRRARSASLRARSNSFLKREAPGIL